MHALKQNLHVEPSNYGSARDLGIIYFFLYFVDTFSFLNLPILRNRLLQQQAAVLHACIIFSKATKMPIGKTNG